MSVQLNHTIVYTKDRRSAARAVAAVLGLSEPSSYGPFTVVELQNGVSLDFATEDGPIAPQHYAFLVDEDDFDAIWARIRRAERPFWSDPFRCHEGKINRNDGGRGVYWEGPDGHWLEIITRPYGTGSD